MTDKLSSKEVWNKIINERQLDTNDDIIDLISDNIDRVVFVKDAVGLRDYLFIAEKGTEIFESKIHSYLDSDYSPDMKKANDYRLSLELNLEKIIYDSQIILENLTIFFNETSRKLFLGIGFVESQVFDEEKATNFVKSKTDIASGKTVHPNEVMKYSRNFPNWYEKSALFPEETFFIPKEVENSIANLLNKDKINSLISDLEDSLTESEEHKLSELKVQLKFIENNL